MTPLIKPSARLATFTPTAGPNSMTASPNSPPPTTHLARARAWADAMADAFSGCGLRRTRVPRLRDDCLLPE
jgi:hypothetical protein